jgi:hypothetical protein
MASKSSTAAKNVYTPLVMVSLGAWKTTLAGNTDFHGGSIDTNFYPPQFRLDSTFKKKHSFFVCVSEKIIFFGFS